MQPYFAPTRKTTSTKNGRRPQKQSKKNGRPPQKKIEDDLKKNIKKWKTTSKKIKKIRRPNFFFEKLE